jgi:hypothetical protein
LYQINKLIKTSRNGHNEQNLLDQGILTTTLAPFLLFLQFFLTSELFILLSLISARNFFLSVIDILLRATTELLLLLILEMTIQVFVTVLFQFCQHLTENIFSYTAPLRINLYEFHHIFYLSAKHS